MEDACHDMNDNNVKKGAEGIGVGKEDVTEEQSVTPSVNVERTSERAAVRDKYLQK